MGVRIHMVTVLGRCWRSEGARVTYCRHSQSEHCSNLTCTLASRPHQAAAFLISLFHFSQWLLTAFSPISNGMALANLISSEVSLPKRTRLNVRQSKDGCIICKARKVKCDETKPTCLRCHRAGKVCEGYGVRERGRNRCQPHGAILQWPESPTISRSSSGSPLSSFCQSSLEANQSRLGLEILTQQLCEQTRWDEQPLWVRLVAQSLPTNEAVSRAVIALGASFEAHFLPASLVQRHQASAQNQQAINALRKELASPSQGLVPVFLACVLLAAAEVLERHLANALVHVKGAFQAITCTDVDAFADLHSLAQSLDLQTSWYMLSEPPRLRTLCEPWDGLRHRYSTTEIQAGTVALLHSCYHFTGRAGNFKYRSRAHQPASLIMEQSRCIAKLTHWLATYNRQTTESILRLPTLRAQCLSTLIYVSTILCPHELTYDLYLAHFQQIVEIAEEVVASRSAQSPSLLQHFKFQPGLLQPLYLTAMKCRDPQLRRRAVRTFSCLGVEGPWDARVLTRVAQRAIEIEELDEQKQQRLPIPEVHRLHGCGIDSLAPAGKTFPIFIQAHFSLCTDVEQMLRSDDDENSEHWTLWSEDLEIGSFYGLQKLGGMF